MASVSIQKQPALFMRGMKEMGWRMFNDPKFRAYCDRTKAMIDQPKHVAAIWRAWGGPKVRRDAHR